jgi:hypothetical protein
MSIATAPTTFPVNVTVLDNFNRADASPMTGWTAVAGLPLPGAGFKTLTNQCVPITAAAQNVSWFNTAISGKDVEAYIEMPTLPSQPGGSIEIYARGNPSAGGYVGTNYAIRWQGTPNLFQIGRHDPVFAAGVVLAENDAVVLTNGDAIGIRCVGAKIEGWARIGGVWQLVAVAYDDTYDGAAPGNQLALGQLELGAVAARLDNFTGGALTARITLYESLLKHDRPIGWWGLDTADPLEDDSGHGYTLTAVGTPANAAGLVTHGDGGASGSRDFNGTTGGYSVNGSYTEPATEPPSYVASGSFATATTNLVSIPIAAMEPGDLLLVHLANGNNAATITGAPSVMTQVGTTLNATTHATATYKYTPSSTILAATYEWQWSVSASCNAVWGIWRGADPDVAGLVFDSGRQATASGDFHQTTSESNPDEARAIVFWTNDSAGQIIPDATSPSEIRQDIDLLSDPGSFLRNCLIDYVIPVAGTVQKSASSTANSQHGATLVTFGAPDPVAEDVLDTLSETVSIHALISPDTVAAGQRTICAKTTSWLLYVDAATLKFAYVDGAAALQTISGPTVSASTTTHLVVTDDGTNIHFYKNGVETTAARTGAAGYTPSSDPFCIGHLNGIWFFDGKIDEVAVWNVPLSDQMVATYYAAHIAGTFGTSLGHDHKMPHGKLEIAWASAPTDECLVWEDMTAYVRGPVRITRGRSAELDRAETGTMNFALDCNEREFDPENTASPFYPNVKPTRAVRFRAQVQTDAVVYPRFFGYTQGWPQRRAPQGVDIVAAFTAADPAFALALDKIQGSMARPAEYAGARLAVVLADIPNIKYELESGQSEIVSTDLDGVNRLEHAQAVAETDGGIFFAAGDGTMTFQDRHHRTIYEGFVRATFGDLKPENPLEHQDPEVDEAHLFTAARITDAFGRVAESRNDAAALEFFTRTKDLATLHTNENDAQAMAEAYSQRYSTPRERIAEVRINPSTHDTTPLQMWETALSLEISQRIKTVERVGGDGSARSRELFIEGITDSISPFDWRISMATSPAELEGNYWILGVGELGDTSGRTSTRLGW